jgi:hypothetical protein
MGFPKCEYQTVLTSYVYRTVHHLVSWIKIDQLDVTRFIISPFTAQHVSNVSTSVFRSLRLTVDIFHVLYFSVRIDVLASLLSKDANANTSILTEKYNTWNISTVSRKLLKMDVLTLTNMLSSKWWNNKASDIKLVYLYSTILTSYTKECVDLKV